MLASILDLIIIGCLAVVFGLTRRIDQHERVHCRQLGELQHVVAELGDHLRGMTAGPLPPDVAEFVDDILRQDNPRG